MLINSVGRMLSLRLFLVIAALIGLSAAEKQSRLYLDNLKTNLLGEYISPEMRATPIR